MRQFIIGDPPLCELRSEDLDDGIRGAMFYASHFIHACQALETEEETAPVSFSDEAVQLSEVLNFLKKDLDNGRLAIGYVTKVYNGITKRDITARAMGQLIRSCGITTPPGRFRANGKVGARCLKWDEKTNLFLNNVHNVHNVHKPLIESGLDEK